MTSSDTDQLRHWDGTKWVRVDRGDTLPTSDLHQWPPESDAEWQKVDSGAELPVLLRTTATPSSSPKFDENTDPDTAAGTYQWDEPSIRWVSKTPTSRAPSSPEHRLTTISSYKTPADGHLFRIGRSGESHGRTVRSSSRVDGQKWVEAEGRHDQQTSQPSRRPWGPPRSSGSPSTTRARRPFSGATGANTTLSLAASLALAITNIDTTGVDRRRRRSSRSPPVTLSGMIAESNGRTVCHGDAAGDGRRWRRRNRRIDRAGRSWTTTHSPPFAGGWSGVGPQRGRVTCRSLRPEVTFQTRRLKQALDGVG